MIPFIVKRLRQEYNNSSYYYCGYVILDNNEKLPDSYMSYLFDRENSNVLDNYVAVHGGITFDDKFDGVRFAKLSWKDKNVLPLIRNKKLNDDMFKHRTIGFDCNHAGDEDIAFVEDYVTKETLSLYEQLKELFEKIKNKENVIEK